ncbi:MAG: NUDIX hydrolase [Phycisphaeraceae bacterium]|nr:NUDIX hydrolase [Phycisphaeraceae bacterium]
MSDKSPKWLAWAREIQALSQTGLAFNEPGYDTDRYTRLTEIAAEIIAQQTGVSQAEAVASFSAQPGYATVKVDVRGAVIRDGKILLVQERRDERWCMPGGWADIGDKPSDMVAREVWEESGFDVQPSGIIGVYDANRSQTPTEFFHAYKIVFMCDITGGQARSSDETMDVRFFEPESLPPLSECRTNNRHISDVFAHRKDPTKQAIFD